MTLLDREASAPDPSMSPIVVVPPRRSAGVGFIIRKIVWAGALAGMGLAAANGLFSFEMQQGAPQQAAVAAISCFHMITVYVVARAIDQLTRSEQSLG